MLAAKFVSCGSKLQSIMTAKPIETLLHYELYFILPSSFTDEFIEKTIEKNQLVLETIAAKNINTTKQGLKKLLYKIKKNEAGYYIITNFDIEQSDAKKLPALEKALNYNLDIIRYIIVNQTEYLVQKSKEKLNESAEFVDQRQINKGKIKNKISIFEYLGKRVVDYKEVDFLRQFMTPYAKIMGKERTGLTAKAQRKITVAIKRARHMALLPFVGE